MLMMKPGKDFDCPTEVLREACARALALELMGGRDTRANLKRRFPTLTANDLDAVADLLRMAATSVDRS